MPRCQRQHTAPVTAAALEADWRAADYAPGYPPHVSPMARGVDASAARRMKCPGCKRRGLGCKPFSKGPVFRLLMVCPACGSAEEA